MKFCDQLQPINEMPELARFPEGVRRLIIVSAECRRWSFPISTKTCLLGMLLGALSGLIFVLISLGVFCLLVIASWYFGISGFLLAFVGALGAIGIGAVVVRLIVLRGRRKLVRSYLCSDLGRQLCNSFSSS